jgi:hypothetical protein
MWAAAGFHISVVPVIDSTLEFRFLVSTNPRRPDRDLDAVCYVHNPKPQETASFSFVELW